MQNPFKFGSVVEDANFTDREQECIAARQLLDSLNHWVLISPRRFGKTSLVKKVVYGLNRPVIYLDMQLVTDTTDFASQLLKHVLKIDRWEKLKRWISAFRVAPTISFNAASDGMDVTFAPAANGSIATLEDVLSLVEKIGASGPRPIVVFDEFQEIKNLHPNMDKQLRAMMQHHQHVSYVLLGSKESMMRDIFERKKSPFYHFGSLMQLKKIPRSDFLSFLETRLSQVAPGCRTLCELLLDVTDCHPYYTQQLAFYCWEWLKHNPYLPQLLNKVMEDQTSSYSHIYDQFWNTLNKTDQKVLIALATGGHPQAISAPQSTAYSSLRRLQQQGFVVRNEGYEIDDPFFKRWIELRRNMTL
ncbi:MAG: ATP-binding protein [Prevotellaceae bacterium]|jgi:hypothetical protein|nr:ATP-binding protein [Prevotellaceae bacterium]